MDSRKILGCVHGLSCRGSSTYELFFQLIEQISGRGSSKNLKVFDILENRDFQDEKIESIRSILRYLKLEQYA